MHTLTWIDKIKKYHFFTSNYATCCLSVLFLNLKIGQAPYPCSDGAHYLSNRKMPPKLCFAPEYRRLQTFFFQYGGFWRIAHAHKTARSYNWSPVPDYENSSELKDQENKKTAGFGISFIQKSFEPVKWIKYVTNAKVWLIW